MIYAYVTGKIQQDRAVACLARSCGATVLSIKHYTRNGIPRDANSVIFAGILRGTNRLYKDVLRRNLDFYFLDHAYLHSGYDNKPMWLRVTKNEFVQNNLIEKADNERFDRLLHIDFKPWQYRNKTKIVVIPPTSAAMYVFDCHDWMKNITEELQDYIHNDEFEIVVSEKPGQPIIDYDSGEIIGKSDTPQTDWNSLLPQTRCIVTYHSSMALTGLINGIPTICTSKCAAYPVSWQPKDIYDLTSVNRKTLFRSLAMGQFTQNELKRGFAFHKLNSMQQTISEDNNV